MAHDSRLTSPGFLPPNPPKGGLVRVNGTRLLAASLRAREAGEAIFTNKIKIQFCLLPFNPHLAPAPKFPKLIFFSEASKKKIILFF
jgi:hypothetical protein